MKSVSLLRGAAFGAALITWVPAASIAQNERIDVEAVKKIKEEGMKRSQVMDLMSWMTDVYGPRLTNSPNERAAANWALQTFRSWGLSNAHLERWGPFGRSWANEIGVARAISPQPFQIFVNVPAWGAGTNGPVTAEVVLVDSLKYERDLARYKGKLKGKILFTQTPPEVPPRWKVQAERFTIGYLDSMNIDQSRQQAAARAAAANQPAPPRPTPPPDTGKILNDSLRMAFYQEEGVVALIGASRGDGGTMWGGGRGGSASGDRPAGLPSAGFAVEHYGRIYRIVKKGIPVVIEMNIKNVWSDADLYPNNVIAEIPGTDKAGEVVMVGAHFDSWHNGTGATDNGAGSAVMMEAMRILKTLGLPMRRTVRIGLWTGEEQGLLGSRAYVKDHFGEKGKPTPEHDKFSVYFNVDNGTGAIRGVYQQGNEAVTALFKEWIPHFNDLGMTHQTMRNTGGTDHLSFDAVGLPGFQFIQDPIEYDTRTHHSNMDLYERIQADDMMKNATIVAAFVYLAANREALFPRKPLPAAEAPRR